MEVITANGSPRIADSMGREIFNREGIKCRVIDYGDDPIPIKVLLSEAIMKSYDRRQMGIDKVQLLKQAGRDWLTVEKESIRDKIRRGMSILCVSIWFGGRNFDLGNSFRQIIDPNYHLPTIGVKFERVSDRTSASGWRIACWGAVGLDYDYDQTWRPMSKKEKKDFAYQDAEEVLQDVKDKLGKVDIILTGEGAKASGETAVNLVKFIDKFPRFGMSLPSEIIFYANFGSGLGVKRFTEVCREKNITANVTLGGSIIEVSEKGKIPGLPYTDLSQFSSRSITYQELVDRTKNFSVNEFGEIVARCSCGDVGESIDAPDAYVVDTIIEAILWGIPLEKEEWDKYLINPTFVETILRRADEIENDHHCTLLAPGNIPFEYKIKGREMFKRGKTTFMAL